MAEIKLYRDGRFLGGEITVTDDVKNLKSEGFNDVISSVKVVSGTFTLYTDTNFKGSSVTVSPHGGPDSNGEYPSSAFLGGRNDSFSSVKVNWQDG